MAGTLYLVGTPIGNLGDISPRALQTLENVDFIAAEDTRVTLKLLNHFGIKKPLVCYFEHNRAEMGEKLLSRLLAGESCALVTDAGMPAISDPGEDIVRQCAAHGVPVLGVPGPSALVTALALSGLPTQRFTFEGFLAAAGKSRREHLESLKNETRTMCRELTKLHEEVVRTTLSGAVARCGETPPRGEYVLVLRGAPVKTGPEVGISDALALVERCGRVIAAGPRIGPGNRRLEEVLAAAEAAGKLERVE